MLSTFLGFGLLLLLSCIQALAFAPPPVVVPKAAPTRITNTQRYGNIESTLVEGLAERIIKWCLVNSDAQVNCKVDCEFQELLKGSLQGAVINGRNWLTPKGFSCRNILMELKEVQLDLPHLMTKQQIRLEVPALGQATLTFSANDFGNFLAHPMVESAPITSAAGDSKDGTFVFRSTGCRINLGEESILFSGAVDGMGTSAKVKNGPEGLAIDVMPEAPGTSDLGGLDLETLGQELTRYFEELHINLDGIYLRYKSLQITKRVIPTAIQLQLAIEVHTVPDIGKPISF
ncbi:unnamed protein product [Chrysoparadoxa australica]